MIGFAIQTLNKLVRSNLANFFALRQGRFGAIQRVTALSLSRKLLDVKKFVPETNALAYLEKVCEIGSGKNN